MQHLDRLIQRHPKLRQVDFQRLLQQVQADPGARWGELVDATAPIAYTLALRLASGQPNAAAVAEHACFELFQLLREDDFARLRHFIGTSRWPSLMLRYLRETPSLRELEEPADPADPDQALPELDEAAQRALEQEGRRLEPHLERVLRALHRRDRLLLAMRYEQGLSLRELDRIFRLGSAARMASLLDRLEASLQPIRAVGDAHGLDASQRRALLAEMIRRIFARDMQSDEHRAQAGAVQHR